MQDGAPNQPLQATARSGPRLNGSAFGLSKMRIAVLRVSGTTFDPDDILRRFDSPADVVWRAGEPDRRGGVRTESGFNLSVADARSAEELVAQIRKWLEQYRSTLASLTQLGLSAVLDVGLTVGTSAQYTAVVVMSPSDCALIAEAGISFAVSSYPASDEDECG